MKAPKNICKSFVEYFARNWVGYTKKIDSKKGLKTKIKTIEPRFAIEQWNMHQETLDGKARTNNVC